MNKLKISLKWKWSLLTGLGAVLIFAAFSFIMFSSVTRYLYLKESQQTNEVATQINNRLSKNDEINTQTSRSFIPVVNSINGNISRIDRNILLNLNRPNLEVCVLNNQNQVVFTNKNKYQDTKTKGQALRVVQNIKHGNKQIGKVKVVDTLSDYYSFYNRFNRIFTVASLLIFLLVAIFGYILSSWLLRPIKSIKKTMNALKKDPETSARVPDSKSNDELNELGIQFNEMINRMQRYIEQQRQFVEDVSHELRTPVAVVEGHLQMLERWGKDDPQVLEESIKASLEETKRMKSLVAEMLDLTRADQIEINYSNEETEVVKVVYQVFDNFKIIHPEFNFIMDDDIHGAPVVPIYQNHFEQVLVILLDNAVKYSKKRKEIHVSLANTSKKVEIAIQDFGEGISKKDMEKVFNRFYRVDKARSRNQGGNGLGLSIAYKLIHEYHGSLNLESSLGSGSIFRIELPIKEKK